MFVKRACLAINYHLQGNVLIAQILPDAKVVQIITFVNSVFLDFLRLIINVYFVRNLALAVQPQMFANNVIFIILFLQILMEFALLAIFQIVINAHQLMSVNNVKIYIP